MYKKFYLSEIFHEDRSHNFDKNENNEGLSTANRLEEKTRNIIKNLCFTKIILVTF